MIVDIIAKQFLKRIEKRKFKDKILENDISGILEELSISLSESEVHPELVNTLISRIKDKAFSKLKSQKITLTELINSICFEELVFLLGKNAKNLQLESKPAVILTVGLQGTGKTTTVAKLAN